MIAACRSAIEWKLPRRIRRRVSAEKKGSTAFSHEPEVGVIDQLMPWAYAGQVP